MEPEYTFALQTEDRGGRDGPMDTVSRMGYNCPPWAIPCDSLCCSRAPSR